MAAVATAPAKRGRAPQGGKQRGCISHGAARRVAWPLGNPWPQQRPPHTAHPAVARSMPQVP